MFFAHVVEHLFKNHKFVLVNTVLQPNLAKKQKFGSPLVLFF